jgi:hypothetical protein
MSWCRWFTICTINSTRDLYIYVDKNYIFKYAENYEEVKNNEQ